MKSDRRKRGRVDEKRAVETPSRRPEPISSLDRRPSNAPDDQTPKPRGATPQTRARKRFALSAAPRQREAAETATGILRRPAGRTPPELRSRSGAESRNRPSGLHAPVVTGTDRVCIFSNRAFDRTTGEFCCVLP